MPTVQHIIDVTSTLAGITPPILEHATATHSQCFVNARRPMPPGSYGDIIVLHTKASWARLPFLWLLRDDIGDRPLIVLEEAYSRAYELHCVANRKRFHCLLSLTYNLADLVVTASESQRLWLLENCLVMPDKVTSCMPLHDVSELIGLSAPAARREQPLRLVSFGGPQQQSGIDILIEAMKRLPKGLATLEICCKAKDVNAICRAVDGVPGVHIAKEHVVSTDYLARSDAVVMPSRWQPSALMAHQACTAARPLVATNIDALEDFASHDWGEIVASDSSHDLAAAITRLAARPLNELGAAARAAALERDAQSRHKWADLLSGLK